MTKHPDVGGLFQDDSAPIHLAWGVTKWFDENDVKHVLWLSQSPDLNSVTRLLEILNWYALLITAIIKTQQ